MDKKHFFVLFIIIFVSVTFTLLLCMSWSFFCSIGKIQQLNLPYIQSMSMCTFFYRGIMDIGLFHFGKSANILVSIYTQIQGWAKV